MDDFKRRLFGTSDVILPTADITRNRCGFERMKDTPFRERFYRELNDLMSGLEYKAVACVIRKDHHLAKYGLSALDLYMLSFDILVERFCFEIGHVSGGGLIVAEERHTILDRDLDLAYLNLKIQGTRYIRARDIVDRISGLNLRPKSENVPGLQLADLVVSPIGRHVLGKQDKEDWRIVERKFRRTPEGRVQGAGLVILPK